MKANRAKLIQRLARHGAEHVTTRNLLERSDIIWRITPTDDVSETCIKLEELTASAARSARSALSVISRIADSGDNRDQDLLTALKKYVEDACEAIKVVDTELKNHGASLHTLLYEVPNTTHADAMSWRNLIGRRDVIAHRILTVDNEQVYIEAVRDFSSLEQLLSNVFFVPIKTDLQSRRLFSNLLRSDRLRNLGTSEAGTVPSIGQALIFIYEDIIGGFLSLRVGRNGNNKVVVASSPLPPSVSLSIDELAELFSLTGVPNEISEGVHGSAR